jgi:AAA ATPase containing von Willebrand factor type A (vWA) domain
MADMITRCPKCGTAFRISDALLKSAKGVVRCGSCLSVFNARDHLEVGRQTSPAPRSQPQPETTKPTAQFAETPAQPQPSFTSPESPAREETFAEREEDEIDTPDWRRREDTETPKPAPSQPEQKPEDDEEDDEAWALELLKDDDDDLNIQFKKIIPKPAPPPEPPAPALDGDETIPSAPAPDFSVLDEDPLIEDEPVVADEDEPAPAATPNDLDEPIEKFAREEEFEDEAETHADESAEDAEQEEILAAAPPPEPPKRKPIRPKLEPKPLKDVIASLEPEPLEVDWQEPGAWRRRLLWPALALVALVCLLAQVAWLEFDRLSRVEPYRSAYAVVCRYVGCQLPELRDRSQIQTSNLLVRSHPDVADALQVDVILQNNAAFEQTFPVLELTFTNLRSEPVASRRLTPAEYLGGELAGRDKMPVRQPIHIALEIADPGRDAVSYHITIVD